MLLKRDHTLFIHKLKAYKNETIQKKKKTGEKKKQRKKSTGNGSECNEILKRREKISVIIFTKHDIKVKSFCSHFPFFFFIRFQR